MNGNNQENNNNISIHYLRTLFQKKWLTIVIILLIFLMYASYNAFLKKKIYEVKFCIAPISSDIKDPTTPIIESSTLEVIVNNFCINYENLKSEILTGKNYINSNSLRSFNKLSVAPSISESGDKKNNIVEITLFVYDTTYTENIIKDLISFINQNSLIKDLFKEKEKALIISKEKVEKCLNEMIAFKDNMQNNKSQINIINFNIYKDIIETQNELANINIRLKNSEAVKIVADAVNPKKSLGVSPLLSYLIFSFLGLITAFCFVIIIDKLNKKV